MTRLAVFVLAGAFASGALAAAPVESETARSGDVRATIFYTPGRFVVRLVVDRAGKRLLDERVPPYSKVIGTGPLKVYIGGKSIAVSDLDGDREPEILLDFYSGAAHCCFWSRIYSWDAAARTFTTFAHLWRNVNYRLADLNEDRYKEFVSADDRFAYLFTSFAGSGFPLQIWTYRTGRLVDTTRAYPPLIAKDAAKQWRWYRDARRKRWEVRGFLAAWAADESLLGRGEAAFAQLRRLSLSGTLDAPQSSAAVYLRELRSFLRRTGYLR